MTAWLDPLRRTLDGRSAPATLFFRDDDAGWDDDALFRLLGLFADHRVGLDLAVIPTAATPVLAQCLRDWNEAMPAGIGLHQHGYTHHNHEVAGRKCEFGVSRSGEAQTADLRRGQERLLTLFGDDLDPFFTPPWNRCTQETVDGLTALGFHLLSRDATAKPLALGGMAELPVTIDWLRKRDGAQIGRDVLGSWLAGAAASDATVGIMLHHAAMDGERLAALRELLELVASHPSVECRLMREVVAARPGTAAEGSP